MKKMMIAALVAIVGIAFTAPAFAVEHEFGGYFRVRAFTAKHFDGTDKEDVIAGTPSYALNSKTGAIEATTPYAQNDASMIDSRTRLYYTAQINDNLKFVSKFEMDADWGDSGYGKVGADGVKVEVKHTYVDFNLGALNAKLGTQGATLSRGFIFDDDFSGAVLSAGSTAFVFAKAEENSANCGDDVQFYTLMHTVATDAFSITPEVTYVDLADSSYIYFLALNADVNLGAASAWATLIYEGGEFDATDTDVSAYLVAFGGDFAASDVLSIHGQAFYATGDDDGDDYESFGGADMPGSSYYWAEIMGLGTFDDAASAGAPADDISNVAAFNLGTTFKASEKLSLSADLWYAILAEENAAGDDKLGTELDLQASYQLIDGLTLDVVAAYLFADDATYKGDNDEDPYELGAQLSLSF
ncbi:MAG: hypothetical protein GY737_13735 [Desulfobacteraceae bacterium]|nr:hypothetical protein [Desulfobacteraceae bacterium]